VGLPLVLAILITYFNLFDLRGQVANLLTVVGITGGFLINLLALIYNVIDSVRKEYPADAVKTIYAKEIHANISFGIVLSMFCCLLLLIYGLKLPSSFKSWLSTYPQILPITKQVIEGFLYFLLGIFFLTLLMIIKRIFTIMDNK
jgi:hypothetical protein